MSSTSVGRPPIPPLPPKRDPKTTLSVGRARARSMLNNFPELEALDRAIHDYDSEGRSTNSSSVDSDTYKVPTVKVASIRNRPTSSRLTSRELEEMFARQGSAPRYPPTAGQGGPRVYASVAEMKRHKVKKSKGNSGPLESVYVGDSGSLRKDFLSTPDLKMVMVGCGERRSHSQEDLHALQHGPGARLGPHVAWNSTEHLYGRGRRASAETSSETSEEVSLRGGVRRPRHLKNRDAVRGRGRTPRDNPVVAGGSEYAVPPVTVDGSGRRVPSTFRPALDAKLYASPTELKTLAFHDGSEQQSTLRRRLQNRSRSVPPANRPASSEITFSQPATPTSPVSGDETTPTNTPTSPDIAELYAQPVRRQQLRQQPQQLPVSDEDLPPPPAALLQQKPSTSPSMSQSFGPSSPAEASLPSSNSTLQSLLAEKVAERQRRLSLGEATIAQALEEASPTKRQEQESGDYRVEQVTRIKVGKKPQTAASGIPSPKGKTPPAAQVPGMTKSHTIGSLSGDDLRAARSKLRSNSRIPQPSSAGSSATPTARDAEEGDNSSSGVSSDQDLAQPKYVTFIPTEGSPFMRRQEESDDSESSDDTSDRTWILSSERGRQPAAPGGGKLPRAVGADTRRASSIPCLAMARNTRAQTATALPSSLSSKARPVSITVPSGRPTRESKHLRFGGTTTVVITGGGSSSPEPEPEPEPVELSIERSMQQIEQNARQLASSGVQPAVPVVPPPPEFDGGLVLPPPPEFSDPAGGGEGAKKTGPKPPPKPANPDTNGSRLVKPKTLGLKPRSPTSPNASSPTSPTNSTVTSPRASGIPRLGANSSGATRRPGLGSPSKIPGVVKNARLNSTSAGTTTQYVKNRFRTVPVSQWTVEDTCDWLEGLFMSEHKARFTEAGVDGSRLLQLDGPGLAELGVKRMGHRMNIEKSLKRHGVQVRNPARQS